jgi:flavin-dependent dehydrogenase
MAVQCKCTKTSNERRTLKLESNYDLVIIGGGPAGLAAAISILQKVKISVLIIEGQDEEHERIGESCPPDTLLLLKQLGVSKEFTSSGVHATCPGHASVWGREAVGYNDFIVNPLGPAWRLNRREFDGMLANRARSLGAEIQWSTRFTHVERKANGEDEYVLQLMDSNDKSTSDLSARFVVDASGSTARFAKALGIERKLDDQLFAIVRFAKIEDGKLSKQVQLEAASNGWWYNALLPDQRVVTMAVVEKENLNSFRDNNYEGFMDALTSTTFVGNNVAKLSVSKPEFYTWPIHSGILSEIEGRDWMAIGDAASCYDPIAAQGIYKALTDAILASDKLEAFFANNTTSRSSFSEQVRKRYEMYSKNRAHVYGLEQRWTTHSFWKNRHAKSHELVANLETFN